MTPNIAARFFVLSLSVALAGCGANNGAGDMSPNVDYDTESTDTATHGASPTALSMTKGISSLFVQEDPTIDPTKSAGANADSVAAQATKSVMSCAMATVTHVPGTVTLSVNFGAGCTLPSIGSISGLVTVTLGKSMTGIGVTLALTNVVAGGQTLTGTVELTTVDGTTYSTHIDITAGTVHVNFDGTALLDANGLGVTLNGSGQSQVNSGIPQSFTAKAIHHTFTACYADAGIMALDKSTMSRTGMAITVGETITFNSSTPSTGMVTITVAGIMSMKTLPKYGTCPHS